MISLELMKSSVVRKAGDRSMYALQTIVYAGIWKILLVIFKMVDCRRSGPIFYFVSDCMLLTVTAIFVNELLVTYAIE